MNILAIDPGCTESAWVQLHDRELIGSGKLPNRDVLSLVRTLGGDVLVVESVASYGMAVGFEVFETCVWTGRYIEAWESRNRVSARIYRADIKLHLCGTMKAKDGNIRRVLLDLYGGDGAVGTKKKPGPLYGVSGDVWAALAVAVCWQSGVRSQIKGA